MEKLKSIVKKEPKFLAFLVPTVIMLVLFALKKIYPFGDRSFLFSDMYHQYMPFFSEFMRKIKAGEGLSYSYNVGIGSNFYALYVYYLASPLHWLAFLFPQEHLMEFMSYLVVVKIGLCGLTSCIYLQKHFQAEDKSVLPFAWFYALSGFIAAYNWNIMWLDCVVLLPLIVLALEKLVSEGRGKLYCILLALSILTNFYISIMVCIFLALYFIVLLVNSGQSVRRMLKTVGRFALYSVLAAGMAAVLLLPAVSALISSDFGDMDFPKKLESYFSVLDMLTRHCMNVATERGLDHWPNIYCGVAVFLLLPMYVLNQKIRVRKRFSMLALCGFILLGFSTNILNFIWHGFNYPNSLPARQSFIYIFLIITLCYEAYRHLNDIEEKHIIYGYLAAAAALLFCEKFADGEDFTDGVHLLSLLFVTVYAAGLYIWRTRKSGCVRAVTAVILTAAVIAESGINMYMTSLGTTSRSAYLSELEDYRLLYDWTAECEDGFYRVEKFTRKTKNDGALAGYPTASVFSSTMNSYVMDMYEKLGMRHSKVYYGFDGATPFTAALLNVKYMFGEDDVFDSTLYQLKQKSGDIYLYESSMTLPFGYVAPTGYDFPEGTENNGIRLQNKLVNELGISQELFEEEYIGLKAEKVEYTANVSGYHYARLTSSGTAKIDAVGGSLEEQNFKDLKKECILYLGYMEKGDTITLTNADEDDTTPSFSATFYHLNEQVLSQALNELGSQHLTDVEYDSTNLSGHLSLAKAGRLILSIPYEKGFTVTINGEKAEPQLFGGTLMAFDLEPGEYELELHYVPAGRNMGILLSVISLAVFGGLVYWDKKGSSRQRSRGRRLWVKQTGDLTEAGGQQISAG